EWLGKLLLDIEDIRPGSMGQPATIEQIVILQDPAAADANAEPSPAAGRKLSILLDRLDDPLLDAIRRVEGVQAVKTAFDYEHPLLTIRAASRTQAQDRVEALCRQHGIVILDVIKRAPTQPSFAGPARLEAITRSQAVMELLRRFEGGHKSALLQESFGGSSGRLFMELASLVSGADCHNLYVGPLPQMADLVAGLAGL
ncbi:MAG: hypothetical protein ACE5G8_17640, partial [Anaerolineae bacterium]